MVADNPNILNQRYNQPLSCYNKIQIYSYTIQNTSTCGLIKQFSNKLKKQLQVHAAIVTYFCNKYGMDHNTCKCIDTFPFIIGYQDCKDNCKPVGLNYAFVSNGHC